MIDRLRWGVGSLDLYPYTGWHTSRCPHDRLIYPVMWDGQIVAFRGRQIAYTVTGSPGSTWQAAYQRCTALTRFQRGVLVLCENPIDAMLVHEYQHGDVLRRSHDWRAGTGATIGLRALRRCIYATS